MKNNAENKTIPDNEWVREVHPDWYRDVGYMRCLILGNFPPSPARREYEFYYPNRRNRFWIALSELAGIRLQWPNCSKEEAVEERYRIMCKLQIGVQNLGREILRKGTSALDVNIKLLKFENILSILDAHPELNKILLPGFSAPNSTAPSFLKYLKENNIAAPEIKKFSSNTKFSFSYCDREIRCYVLYSTSRALPMDYSVILEQFRRHLG